MERGREGAQRARPGPDSRPDDDGGHGGPPSGATRVAPRRHRVHERPREPRCCFCPLTSDHAGSATRPASCGLWTALGGGPRSVTHAQRVAHPADAKGLLRVPCAASRSTHALPSAPRGWDARNSRGSHGRILGPDRVLLHPGPAGPLAADGAWPGAAAH